MRLITPEYPVSVTGTTGFLTFTCVVNIDYTIDDLTKADKLSSQINNYFRDIAMPKISALTTKPYLGIGLFLSDAFKVAMNNWPKEIQLSGLFLEYKQPNFHVIVP